MVRRDLAKQETPHCFIFRNTLPFKPVGTQLIKLCSDKSSQETVNILWAETYGAVGDITRLGSTEMWFQALHSPLEKETHVGNTCKEKGS